MRGKRIAALAATAAMTISLAACSADSAASTDAAATDGTTVTHAFGETVIPENIENVATIAWGNQDTALALGVVPAGMAAQTWGVEDGSGMLPWTKDELGAETPVLFDETDGIDFEAVADTQPDVILAAYSGLTQEEYETLSGIAPTVAYPEIAWSTPWRDQIATNSAALNLATEGEALTTELETLIDEKVGEHPELAGMSAAFFYGGDGTDLSTVSFYNTGDPRAAYLEDLGFEIPQSVIDASEGSEDFFHMVSAENVDQLADIDVIVLYGDESTLELWQNDPLLSTIPAVQNGAVVVAGLDGSLAASLNPTPLSIPYSIDEYLGLLTEAASKAK